MTSAMVDTARILLADDEEDVHFICRINLELEGFAMGSARNGAEVLRQVARERPDAILLDVMMPVMDGWECLSRLKADPSLRDIAVIMLTAKVHQEDQIRGLAGGADAYVTKPFHPMTVLAAVREVLEAGVEERKAKRLATLRQLELLQRL